MADGRDDRVARGPKKGHKLANSGDENGDYAPGYSGDDQRVRSAYLNENVKMSTEQRGTENPSSECCKSLGLNLKERLS